MEFSNENYRIVMNTETSPHLHRFSIVHNPENINTEDFYMARVLEIKNRHGDVLTVALLDTLCFGYPAHIHFRKWYSENFRYGKENPRAYK